MNCESCKWRRAGEGYRFCFHCGATARGRVLDKIHATEPDVPPDHTLVHGNIQAIQKRNGYTKVSRRKDA